MFDSDRLRFSTKSLALLVGRLLAGKLLARQLAEGVEGTPRMLAFPCHPDRLRSPPTPSKYTGSVDNGAERRAGEANGASEGQKRRSEAVAGLGSMLAFRRPTQGLSCLVRTDYGKMVNIDYFRTLTSLRSGGSIASSTEQRKG